jgi:hypothetical protein
LVALVVADQVLLALQIKGKTVHLTLVVVAAVVLVAAAQEVPEVAVL